MRMREFIRQNRQDIDDLIDRAVGDYAGPDFYDGPGRPLLRRNDSEREIWIMNNESLYHWARREGVPV